MLSGVGERLLRKETSWLVSRYYSGSEGGNSHWCILFILYFMLPRRPGRSFRDLVFLPIWMDFCKRATNIENEKFTTLWSSGKKREDISVTTLTFDLLPATCLFRFSLLHPGFQLHAKAHVHRLAQVMQPEIEAFTSSFTPILHSANE